MGTDSAAVRDMATTRKPLQSALLLASVTGILALNAGCPQPEGETTSASAAQVANGSLPALRFVLPVLNGHKQSVREDGQIGALGLQLTSKVTLFNAESRALRVVVRRNEPSVTDPPLFDMEMPAHSRREVDLGSFYGASALYVRADGAVSAHVGVRDGATAAEDAYASERRGLGGTLRFPLVHARNYGFESAVFVHNASDAPRTLTLKYYPSDGPVIEKTRNAAPRETLMLSPLDDIAFTNPWYAGLSVESDGPLAGVSFQRDSDTVSAFLPFVRANEGNSAYLPLVHKNNASFFSGIAAWDTTEDATTTNDLTLSVLTADGRNVSDPIAVPANGVSNRNYYPGNAALGKDAANFFGAGVLSSTSSSRPFLAITNQLKRIPATPYVPKDNKFSTYRALVPTKDRAVAQRVPTGLGFSGIHCVTSRPNAPITFRSYDANGNLETIRPRGGLPSTEVVLPAAQFDQAGRVSVNVDASCDNHAPGAHCISVPTGEHSFMMSVMDGDKVACIVNSLNLNVRTDSLTTYNASEEASSEESRRRFKEKECTEDAECVGESLGDDGQGHCLYDPDVDKLMCQQQQCNNATCQARNVHSDLVRYCDESSGYLYCTGASHSPCKGDHKQWNIQYKYFSQAAGRCIASHGQKGVNIIKCLPTGGTIQTLQGAGSCTASGYPSFGESRCPRALQAGGQSVGTFIAPKGNTATVAVPSLFSCAEPPL